MKENKENLVDEEKLIGKELAEEMQELEQERNKDKRINCTNRKYG